MHLKGKKSPKVEFRSEDEAWYDVSVQLKGKAVKIQYTGFSHDSDELLQSEEFKSAEDVRTRFRFSSQQLQDQQCRRVTVGMAVCVSCSGDGEDVRFFDAVVERVSPSKHRVVDGEDECRCAFVVLWLAGPHANERTTVYCENICLLMPGIIETHPVINALVKLVEQKTDCRMRSVGRNPSKKNVARLRDRLHAPGSFSTNFESEQGESGQTTMEAESTGDVDKHRRLNKQKDGAFKTIEEAFTDANEKGDRSFAPKADCISHYSGFISSQLTEKLGKSDQVNATEENLVDETLLINMNKGVESSLGPKADCASCSRTISSQSEERQKPDGVDFTERTLIGREALLQKPVANDDEHEYLVKGVSDIGSDTNTSSHSHRGSDLHLPKQDDSYDKMARCDGDQRGPGTFSETNTCGQSERNADSCLLKQVEKGTKMSDCEGESNACTKDSIALASSLSSCNMNIQDEIISKRSFEAPMDAATIVTEGNEKHFSSIISSMRNSCEPPVHDPAILSECMRTHFDSDNLVTGSYEAHTDTATILSEGKGTDLNPIGPLIRKEERPCLPDLNSIPVDLEMAHPCVPSTADVIDSNGSHNLSDTCIDRIPCLTTPISGMSGNNIKLEDKRSRELDDNYVVIRNERSCSGGFFESEGYDNPSKEDSRHPVVQSGMASKSSYLAVDHDISIRNKEHRILEDHKVTAYGGAEMLSSSLVPENQDESDGCERPFEISSRQNGKVHEIAEDLERKKAFLASSWGRGKRQNHTGNEIFISNESLVWADRQNEECVQAWEQLACPRNENDGIDSLRSNGSTTPLLESHKRKRLVDSSVDFCGHPDKILRKEDESLNPGEVDTFRSSCLTTHLESHKRQEPASIPTNLCDLPDQICREVDEIGKATCYHEQLTKHVSSVEMQSKKVVPEAVAISSDSENDNDVQDNISVEKKCYDTKDFRRQRKTCDVQLQDGLSVAVEQKGGEFGSVQRNGCRNRKERHQYCASRCKGRKNMLAVEYQGSSRSDSELYNGGQSLNADYTDSVNAFFLHRDQGTVRDHQSPSNECKNPSPCCDTHSKLVELNNRYIGLQQWIKHSEREHSDDLFELDGSKNGQLNCCSAYMVHGKECGVCAVHSPKDFSSSASAEGDSNVIGEKDELCDVENCEHNNEFMKSKYWNNRANDGIQKIIVKEARHNCTEQGVRDIYLETEHGHGNEAGRADESWFSSSLFVMLDNLERDVDSFDVLDVISQATCGIVRVCIMPSLKYEKFTRGFVFFRDHASLQRAATFLQDNDFLIVSSEGRPWVVHHEIDGVMEGIYEGSARGHKDMLPSWTTSTSKILIVHKGTREYEQAKMRQNLFLDFREHVTLLHRRLEHEESMVLLRPMHMF